MVTEVLFIEFAETFLVIRKMNIIFRYKNVGYFVASFVGDRAF